MAGYFTHFTRKQLKDRKVQLAIGLRSFAQENLDGRGGLSAVFAIIIIEGPM
jgi:hypothetical protein